jgi:hypothetical protein
MEHIASPRIRTGFFIIADISGYTSFLTDTELGHAQEIIEEIIRLLLDHIQPPLKIVQLEGDAVFYYVPEEMLPEPERLLEHIEACYCDFVSVAGPGIILLHRLLKNGVTEKTGLRGYALMTNAYLDRIGMPSSITAHTETYEHIGEVRCGLHDLQAYEHKMRDVKRVYLERGDADYIYERILAASPELLWSFIIDPERRKLYQTIKELKPVRNSSGRMGIGAEFHCDHGAFTRVTQMLDWRPFHYMTNTTVQSFHKLPLKSPKAMVTFNSSPLTAGTPKYLSGCAVYVVTGSLLNSCAGSASAFSIKRTRKIIIDLIRCLQKCSVKINRRRVIYLELIIDNNYLEFQNLNCGHKVSLSPSGPCLSLLPAYHNLFRSELYWTSGNPNQK